MAQLVWPEPQGTTLLPGDSRIQPGTRCRPLQTAVRKEEKHHEGFRPAAGPVSHSRSSSPLPLPGRWAEARFGSSSFSLEALPAVLKPGI